MEGVRGAGGAVVGLLGALVATVRRDLDRLVRVPSIALPRVSPNERVLLTERGVLVAKVEFIDQYAAVRSKEAQ